MKMYVSGENVLYFAYHLIFMTTWKQTPATTVNVNLFYAKNIILTPNMNASHNVTIAKLAETVED